MTETHDALWLGAGIQPSRIFCLVSATLMVYDYVCTLNREVKLVWKRRLGTLATILFLLNRYLPYFYVFTVIKEYWSFAHSQGECRRRDIGTFAPIVLNLFISEVILALRTWAIWNRSKAILKLFLAMWSVKISLVLLASYYMFRDAHYINISPTEIFCISPTRGNWSWETLGFIVILIIETVIAILTLVKVVQARRSSSRWYFKVMYMGIIYYFYNLLMTVINLIGTIHIHNMGVLSFAILQGVLQSVLGSRVIFLARSSSEFGIVSEETDIVTTFRARVAGSRGTETDISDRGCI